MNTVIQDNFSVSLSSSVKLAKSLALKDEQSTYGVPHLALALLYEATGLEEILNSLNKDISYIVEWFEMHREIYQSQKSNDRELLPDTDVEKVFEESERSKLKLGTDYIDAVCIFTAIIRQGVVYSNQQIETLAISESEILQLYDTPIAINTPRFSADATTDETSTTIPFCSSLITQKYIEEGALVVGRDKEIRTIIENLDRKESSGILIVGDAGVGKTSVLKGLVNYLASSKDPMFSEKQIIGLNPSKLLASITNPHEVSKKLDSIFSKVKNYENTLLVIDDINVLVEASSASSTAIIHLITSELADKNLTIIATINAESYRKTIENTSLNRKMEVIALEELSEDFILYCLENHAYTLVAHYQIKIDEEAIQESIQHSKRYFKEAKLPYGAIDLLDRTLASAAMSNQSSSLEIESLDKQFQKLKQEDETYVRKVKLLYQVALDKINAIVISQLTLKFNFLKSEEATELHHNFNILLEELKSIANAPITVVSGLEVAAIVSSITGIPLGKIQAEEKERLLNIEEKLVQRVKGQDHAINTLSDAIIESRSGLSNPQQPIGSFFFLGPTGTGKTELAKSLAELLFDNENAMIRFDMSEFKEEHSAALLYGAPPGYVGYEEGGMLVNKIRKKPYSVVLFDEIEKAHSSVYDVFLQIMDEGKIHDKLGREGDFSNSIIIFTSNIGSEWIADQFDAGIIPTSNALIEVMTTNFRPEFLGRLTEVVPFAPINKDVAKLIFNLHLNRLQQQLVIEKDIKLTVSDTALEYLSNKGYSKKYGARPIAGVIRTYIKKTISRMIVAETIMAGDEVLLTYLDESLVWEKEN